MKTIYEYFKELPEEYRDKAVNNLHDKELQFSSPGWKCASAADALDDGFDWEASPEGFKYWKALYKLLKTAT